MTIKQEIIETNWNNVNYIIDKITHHFKNPHLPNQEFFKTQLFNRLRDLLLSRDGEIDEYDINKYLSEFVHYHFNETFLSKEEFDLGLQNFKEYMILNFYKRVKSLKTDQIIFADGEIYTWDKIIRK